MDSKKNKIIEEYLNAVRKEIHNLAPADSFLEALRRDLLEFADVNPSFTKADLESEFGSPEELAKDFLEENSAVQPKEVAKSKKRKNIIIGILIVLLIAGAIYVADLASHTQGMATDVIIIEEGE